MKELASSLAILLVLICPLLCPLPSHSDSPAAPPPSTVEVANIGLQMVRSRAVWDAHTTTSATFDSNVPISTGDVLAETRSLSAFAPAVQNYIQSTFHKYATSSQSFSYEDERVLRAAAKTSLESLVQERQVCFKLRPFMEILPVEARRADSRGNIGSVGYGQSINLDNPDFGLFLRSLVPVQKQRITHSGGLKMNEFDEAQKAFIKNLWQTCSRPECAKFCTLPDTDVEVCFYLEADITQIYDTGSITYFLELPLPAPNKSSYGFSSPKQGQVWMLY